MKRVMLVVVVVLGAAAVLFYGPDVRPPQSGMVPCRPGEERSCFDFGLGPVP